MITHVKENQHTRTGPSSKFLVTFTLRILRTSPEWGKLPTTATLTDSWHHGTYNFETSRKDSWGISFRLSTMGPRRYV